MDSRSDWNMKPLKVDMDSRFVHSGSVTPRASLEDDSPSSSDSGGFRKGLSRPNRDPMSHRIIEKRRRDRMNNCLSNLSKLIPNSYLKKGRGRIEKTEIIEMAIRYMSDRKQQQLPAVTKCDKAIGASDHRPNETGQEQVAQEKYKQGVYDCIAETLRFLAAADGWSINETTKTQLILHLREYFGHAVSGPLGPSISSLLHQPSASFNPVPVDSDQPLNMSLKPPKRDPSNTPGCSQLREILSEAKRPPVFRYQPGGAAPLAHVASDPGPLGLAHLTSSSSSSGSSQYPSSPGSSSRSVSAGSSLVDSPPRVVSPPVSSAPSVAVPIFALHPSGLFYLASSVQSRDMDAGLLQQLSCAANSSLVNACHPVTIPVSFCPNLSANDNVPDSTM